jgi:hypothetical protein
MVNGIHCTASHQPSAIDDGVGSGKSGAERCGIHCLQIEFIAARCLYIVPCRHQRRCSMTADKSPPANDQNAHQYSP